MSLTPTKTPTQDHASGEEHAVRLVGEWLAKEGLQGGDKAKDLVDALKAGPPRLVILQQGRVEELVEALATLRAENEALEADQSARGELQQRIGNVACEALRIADTLLAAKRSNPGNAEFVDPAIGQVWRGMHPRYGFGHFEEAEIIEITDRRILLRWLDGSGTHHTTPDLFGPTHTWSFVRTST